MRLSVVVVCIAVFSLCGWLPAQDFVSPSGLSSALAEGAQAKGRFQGVVLTDTGVTFGEFMVGAMAGADLPSGFRVVLYTPVAWVKQQASDAAKQYRPLSAKDLTPEMCQNVFRARVYPSMPTMVSARGTLLANSVQHVVIRDAQRQRVVQPLSSEPFLDEAQNAMGARVNYQGISATFSLDEIEKLRDQNDEFVLTVVTDRGDRNFKIKRRYLSKLPFTRIPAPSDGICNAQPAAQPLTPVAKAIQAANDMVRQTLATAYATAPASAANTEIVQVAEASIQALKRVDASFKVSASPDAINAALIDAQVRFDELQGRPDVNVLSKIAESLGFSLQGFKDARGNGGEKGLAAAREALQSASANLESFKTTARQAPPTQTLTPASALATRTPTNAASTPPPQSTPQATPDDMQSLGDIARTYREKKKAEEAQENQAVPDPKPPQ